MNNYHIVKIMNNNVLLTNDLESGTEIVLIGRGIGFGVKKNTDVYIPKEKIEKSFRTFDQSLKKDYMTLIDSIDSKVIAICAEIILYAEERLGNLSPRVHIVLTDHIAFALERIKMGMDISNPFLLEIKSMYQKEFEIARKAKEMIAEATGIEISEEEMGFITLHLNAAREHRDVKQKLKYTRLVQELIQIVERELKIKINPSDLSYSRLVNHLKGSIDRIDKGQSVENPLLDTIKKEFPDSFWISKLIKAHIEKIIKKDVSEYELGYMTIHIDRIRRTHR